MTIRFFSRCVAAMMAALLLAAPAAAANLTSAEKAAIAALKRPDGAPVRLDLSNPKQKAALMALWRVSGVARDKMPARLAVPKKGKAKAKAKGATATATPTATLAPVVDFLGFSGADWDDQIAGHVVVTPGAKTQTVEVTVTLLNPQQEVIASSSNGSEQSAAPVFATSTEGANSAATPVTAMVSVFILAEDGTPWSDVYSWTGTQIPTEMVNIAPAAASQVVNRILVCLVKSVSGCNYTTKEAGKIELPVQGSVTFAGPINVNKQGKPINATAQLYAVNRTTGAMCSNGAFFDDRKTQVSGATLSWDIAHADFGSACYEANGTYDFVLSLKVGVGAKPVWAAVGSSPTLTYSKGTADILPFQMLQGSGGVVSGTMVSMADGSSKTVQSVAVGDKLAGGVTVYATYKSSITESNTLTAATAGAPAAVTSAFDQVVSTRRGALQAQNVLLSDSVTTSAGTQLLMERSQKRLDAAKNVVNLFVSPDTVQTAPAGYMAGGIQVLDATATAP
jgi:hypothetical protein